MKNILPSNSKLLLLQIVLNGLFLCLFMIFKWSDTLGFIPPILLSVGLLLGTVVAYVDEYLLAAQYAEPGLEPHPISRSIVVLLSLIPIGIFALTSTASVLSIGFFFGFSGALLMEMICLYSHPEELRRKFLWQLTAHWDVLQYQWLVAVSVAVFSVFVVMFVW